MLLASSLGVLFVRADVPGVQPVQDGVARRQNNRHNLRP
jgi:hypothetical protein